MTCNSKRKECGCKFNVGTYGLCDTDLIKIDGSNRTLLNWNEISVPEILKVPDPKPNIEYIDKVFVNGKISCAKLIETPFAFDTAERLATVAEITIITDTLGTIDITTTLGLLTTLITVTMAANPLITALPGWSAVSDALTAVTDASTALTDAIDEAVLALALPCLTAAALVLIVEGIQLAINVLVAALKALSAALTTLATEGIGIPGFAALITDAAEFIEVIFEDLAVYLAELAADILSIGGTTILTLVDNEEGTVLTGRKIIVEGTLEQKVVYTGLVDRQSVHSFCNSIPFTAYIIPYAKFLNLEYSENILINTDPDGCDPGYTSGYYYTPGQEIQVDTCEEFDVQLCIEDIFAMALDERTVFKNITVFLKAAPTAICE